MRGTITASRLANLGANIIGRGFDRYHRRFRDITGRARGRFEQRDWQGGQRDIAERLDAYGSVVDRVEAEIVDLLDAKTTDKFVWAGIKAVYSGLIAERDDWELAETFFNSITPPHLHDRRRRPVGRVRLDRLRQAADQAAQQGVPALRQGGGRPRR